jgi:hypothetical protein
MLLPLLLLRGWCKRSTPLDALLLCHLRYSLKLARIHPGAAVIEIFSDELDKYLPATRRQIRPRPTDWGAKVLWTIGGSRTRLEPRA